MTGLVVVSCYGVTPHGISLAVGKIRREHIGHPNGPPKVVTLLFRLRPSLQVTVIVVAQTNTHPVAV